MIRTATEKLGVRVRRKWNNEFIMILPHDQKNNNNIIIADTKPENTLLFPLSLITLFTGQVYGYVHYTCFYALTSIRPVRRIEDAGHILCYFILLLNVDWHDTDMLSS